MAVGSALMRGVRTLARRDFWSFKVIHAVLGGLLTLTGACGGIFVTEQIKKQITVVDGTLVGHDATHRFDRARALPVPAAAGAGRPARRAVRR